MFFSVLESIYLCVLSDYWLKYFDITPPCLVLPKSDDSEPFTTAEDCDITNPDHSGIIPLLHLYLYSTSNHLIKV